jgi:capsular polysaccharide transport system permease protein
MLLASLAIQRRVLGALVLRELQTRYGRDNIGFLWMMVEPLLFATGVLVLWRMLRGAYDHNLPIIALTLFGYLPLLLFRHMVSRALYCIRPNVGLLYHRQVSLFDLFLSRVVVEVAGNILGFVFTFTVLYMMDLVNWPANLPLVLLGYFYMVWFSFAVASVAGALSERSDLVEKFWTPISYLMIPLSGAYIMALWVPARLRDWYLLMPSVHAYEMIRGGYFGDGVGTFWSQPYIAFCSAIITVIGLYLFREARRHLVLE